MRLLVSVVLEAFVDVQLSNAEESGVIVDGVTDSMQVGVVVVGGVIGTDTGICGVAVMVARIAARVRGPTAPKPVLAGDPEETIACDDWKLLTADCVRRP